MGMLSVCALLTARSFLFPVGDQLYTLLVLLVVL